MSRLTEAQIRQAAAAMDCDEKAREKMIRLALAGDNGMRFILHARFYGKGRYAGRALV